MSRVDDRRAVRFWRPDTAAVAGMFALEHEDRLRVTCTPHFALVLVRAGGFDGWSRGRVCSHAAGSLKLHEPGEVHRGVRVHAPYSLQGALLDGAEVEAAAEAAGLRGPPHFRAHALAPGEHASLLAAALHDALVREGASELERTTLASETLLALVGAPAPTRAPRAVQRAREYLRGALARPVSLDELARHVAHDKFHLARAFRTHVGLPPYAYLTQLRVARARELLRAGASPAQAAASVGFCDESQLHRHFRRIVGVTPGVYAASVRARSTVLPTLPKARRRERAMLAP